MDKIFFQGTNYFSAHENCHKLHKSHHEKVSLKTEWMDLKITHVKNKNTFLKHEKQIT